MARQGRLSRGYHSLFHLAQATMHDRWVKRLRVLAFISATSVMSQTLSLSLSPRILSYLGLGGSLPTAALAPLIIALATATWLVAYPAMWARMVTVFAEMEAKKEFEAVLHAVEYLHRHHPAEEASPAEILLRP